MRKLTNPKGLKAYPGRVISQAFVLTELGATEIVPQPVRRAARPNLAEHPNCEQWSHAHDFDAPDYDPEQDLFEQSRYAPAVERVSVFDRTLIGSHLQEAVAETVDLSSPEALAEYLNIVELTASVAAGVNEVLSVLNNTVSDFEEDDEFEDESEEDGE